MLPLEVQDSLINNQVEDIVYSVLNIGKPTVVKIDIDTEANQRQNIFDMMHEYYGDENVLNTLTLKTEGTKSTVQVCAKGFGINNDDAQFLADLIPFERGANWTFKDCFEGNLDKNRLPQTEFINEVAKYPGLKEMLYKIEGLISGRSIHASASYIFDNGYLPQNSRMRAPNGTWITAFNMEDSDYMGGLKIDTLTIQSLDKLHKAINLLIEDNVIEDKGSIKTNYDNYLHPDVLEYNDYRMWNELDKNNINDAFQFDTPMGKQVIITTQPRSMLELSTANTLMRLMTQEGETDAPMVIYRKHKDNINLWYDEMRSYGLNEKEMEIMKEHLGDLYGVADTQESIMKLSMDKRISGFDIVQAHTARRAIAKKKPKLIEEIKETFYNKGKELGTRKELLDYIFNVQFKRQFGYSFSKLHCMPYTCICIQCMNIVLKYGAIYWNCACLIVNSGSLDEESEEGTNYGKISKAMGSMRKIGINITLPTVNRSKFGFYPDRDNNEIIYGLKPIQGIGNKIAKTIIDKRPYNSVNDFYQKMQEYKDESKENKFGDTAMITLIKAGCFDEIEQQNRLKIMEDFIWSICNPVSKLQLSNIEDLNKLGVLTEQQKKYELRLFRFKNYVLQKKNFYKQVGKSPSTAYYKLDRKFSEPFFYEYFGANMKEGKDYDYTEDGFIAVKRGSLEREVNNFLEEFKNDVLTKKENLDIINKQRFQEVWNNKANGNISKWEMDSLGYYYHEHELSHINKLRYDIIPFEDMPQTPEISDHYYYKGQPKPRFKLNRICGTVIDKDKNRHTITLLTQNEVVEVKFYKGQFSFYDRQISQLSEDGTKTVIEKSWFSRGTKLLITGYRREEQFVPKKYNDSIYKHTVQLIKDIDENGILSLQSERAGQEEEDGGKNY